MPKFRGFRIIQPKASANAATVITYGKAVSTGLKANPDVFKTPLPTVETLDTAITELVAADVPIAERSENSRALVKKKIKAVLDILVLLGAYVTGIAAGDRFTASLSGFELSKEETTPIEQKPFQVKEITPGTIAGTCNIVLKHKGGNDFFKVFRQTDNGFVMHDAFMGMNYTLENMPQGYTNIKIVGVKSDVEGPVIMTTAMAL